MKTFQICGYHHSGKTTTAKNLIQILNVSGVSVASIKDIHFKDFQIDQPDKNTFIHKKAGANPVIARGEKETDFLYSNKMGFMEIANKISADWLVVEGFSDFVLPKIVCGKNLAEVDELIDRRTFAISGVISNELCEYKGFRVFNPLKAEDMIFLVKLINEKVFSMLPYVDDKCCKLCGLTCNKMVEAIIQSEKKISDCKINQSRISLKIGEKEISIVPFVQDLLRNNVMAIVGELDGWEKNKSIEITVKSN